MPVLVDTIRQWLVRAGWNDDDPSADIAGVPIFAGPYIQKMPDRIVTITKTPGIGFVFDGAADSCTFQARVRGKQSPYENTSYADAESLASQLDALIYGASFPITVNGQIIIRSWRSGSPPAVLGAGPDDADRYEFVSNYVLLVGV